MPKSLPHPIKTIPCFVGTCTDHIRRFLLFFQGGATSQNTNTGQNDAYYARRSRGVSRATRSDAVATEESPMIVVEAINIGSHARTPSGVSRGRNGPIESRGRGEAAANKQKKSMSCDAATGYRTTFRGNMLLLRSRAL